MAIQGYEPVGHEHTAQHTKKHSAMGIGITTLVTIMVVLLLAAFAVLSLVSARSNHRLAEMTVVQVENYYSADSAATSWYAELDDRAASLTGDQAAFVEQLVQAGYAAVLTAEGEVRVTQSFNLNENRLLTVTIAINEDTTTTIRQWQS